MTIVITRPLDDAVEDAEVLKEEGFETLIEPMLNIEPVPFTLPDLDQYQALLFTSGNAVRLFVAESDRRDIPLYVVGRDTALEAERRGFDFVLDANGTGDDLVVQVQRSIKDKGKPLLHVRGNHVGVPVDAMLADGGIKVDTVMVYEAHKTPHFSSAFIEALKTGKVEAVTFYSRRTAENFVDLIKKGGLEKHLKSIKALCISRPVLGCVQSCEWAETHVAEKMNRTGMFELQQQICTKIQPVTFVRKERKMGKAKKKAAIENAEEVIERFGGIRPMAKKIDVAVTTVQGWKKRNTIPAARRSLVIEAAGEYDVDLTDIVEDALSVAETGGKPPANENAHKDNDKPETAAVEEVGQGIEKPKREQAAPVMASKTKAKAAAPPPAGDDEAAVPEDLAAKLSAMEKKAVAKSIWINAVLILVTAVAVGILLWPEAQVDDTRLSSLEQNIDGLRGDVNAVKDRQSFLSTLVPEDLDQRIASLQQQAHEVQATAGAAMGKAKEISNDVLAENAGTFEERTAKLQGHMAEIATDPRFAGLQAKFEAMSTSLLGQQKLDQASAELSAVVEGFGTSDTALFNQALDAARQRSTTLGQSFEEVPTEDLKAAALLLGMTQFRQSLNRDGQPFADDLQLLMKLVGEDNPELTAALVRLAPRAEEGVLTPGGLTTEFKTIAGDVVVSSLKGEDASFAGKAKARLNELFQAEKDGASVAKTPTQATVTKANELLEQGDIEGAIAQMQTLDGAQAAIAQPWIDEAKATLIAQQVKAFMAGRPVSIDGLGALGLGGSQLIQNEETGINVLKKTGPGH